VVVLSRTLATRFWPGESAVGKRVHVNGSRRADALVIGIADDARHHSRYARPYMAGPAYFSFAQRPTEYVSVLYRSRDEIDVPLGTVRDALHAVDARMALYDAHLMSERVEGEEGALRVVLLLLSTYGVIAVGLCLSGVVSLVATDAEQRRSEIAIRGALGAGRERLAWESVRRTVAAVVAGIGTGALVASLAVRPMAPVFFDVSLTDPLVHVGSAVLVLLLGALAAWLPARRASALAPYDVFRA
jgi:hypothetical protein